MFLHAQHAKCESSFFVFEFAEWGPPGWDSRTGYLEERHISSHAHGLEIVHADGLLALI